MILSLLFITGYQRAIYYNVDGFVAPFVDMILITSLICSASQNSKSVSCSAAELLHSKA